MGTLRLIPGPNPVPAGAYDLSEVGYCEQEYLLSGSARSYQIAAERLSDGKWDAWPDATAPFATRLIVRRPADPASFSGTVVVEWLNVSGGVDAAPDWTMTHTHLMRRRHGWVGVSAQRAGLEGGGLAGGMGLKKAFPDRYAALNHPGDAWSYDIFSQAGRMLRSEPGAQALGGRAPDLLIATGHSQSGAFLVTYINAIDRLAAVYNGFGVHGRPAGGAAIDGEFLSAFSSPGERIRDDLRVPVLVLQSETDVALLGSGRAAQPDSDRLRLWEVAGAAHADTYLLVAGNYDQGNLPAGRLAELLAPTTDTPAGQTDTPINSGPQHHYVACAALEHLVRWAAGGPPAPACDRLHLSDDGRDFHRTYYGIATGGIRTPWTDAPVATLSGVGQTGSMYAFLFGTTQPFDGEDMSRKWPFGRAGYLEDFEEELDWAISQGYLLADDRAEILALARVSYPG